ncbi:MAG: lipopolysaccharide heptosyltransferase II [Gammaproteobacteria bacterium]
MSNKILVIGPSWVGDMIMAQGLFKLLKNLHPQSIIDVVAPPWCEPLLPRMAEVNTAMVLPIAHGELGLARRYRLGKTLAEQAYDWAIVVPRTFKSALVPWFASIPRRTGFLGEMRYGLINDIRARAKSPRKPVIEQYLSLASDQPPGSAPPHPTLAIDYVTQRAALDRLDLPADTRVVGFAPGAEYGPAKRWPPARFAELAEALAQQDTRVWIFGSAKDRPIGEQIMSAANSSNLVNLCGRTTLPEAIDLLACCETVVANDSGLMHAAAAVGSNVVALYGSTPPAYAPPLTDKGKIIHHDLPCCPCFKRECPLGHLNCLSGIGAREVLDCIE